MESNSEFIKRLRKIITKIRHICQRRFERKEVDGYLRSFKASSTFNDLYIRFVILYS